MGAAAVAGIAGGLVVGLIKGQFRRTVTVDLPNMCSQHAAMREHRQSQHRALPRPPAPTADERTVLACVNHARAVSAREGEGSEAAARAIAEAALMIRWLEHKRQQHGRERIYAPLHPATRQIAIAGTAAQVLDAMRSAHGAAWDEWAKLESHEVTALATMDTAMKSASSHLRSAAMTLVDQTFALARITDQTKLAAARAERVLLQLEAERVALADERAYLDDLISAPAEFLAPVSLTAEDAAAVLALLRA